MIVYRVCKEDEALNILNNRSLDYVGMYKNKIAINNHNYDSNIKYLHFFDELSNILYLNLKKGYYICLYDIPEEILNTYVGYGYYTNYIDLKNFENVIEYAIDVKEIKFEYLTKVYRIDEYIDVEVFVDDVFMEYISEVYSRNGEKNYEKTLYKNE